MTQPGPPKLPADLKVLRGTFRRDRDEPKPADLDAGAPPEYTKVPILPEPPIKIGKQGRELWRRLGSELSRAGMLQTPDLSALELLCLNWQQVETLKRRGDTIPTALTSALMTLFSHFAMTPASRNRIVRRMTEQPTAAPVNPFSGHGKRPA